MKIRWKRNVFEEIRRLTPVQQQIEEHCRDLANTAGPGYGFKTQQGRTRARGVVVTTDRRGFGDNLRNNTLVKTLVSKGSPGKGPG